MHVISGVSGEGVDTVLRAMAKVIRKARATPQKKKVETGWTP